MWDVVNAVELCDQKKTLYGVDCVVFVYGYIAQLSEETEEVDASRSWIVFISANAISRNLGTYWVRHGRAGHQSIAMQPCT
jgi:hypothetical protein